MLDSSLQKFKDFVTKSIYGLTTAEAHESGTCIQCREKALPKCYSEAGRKEYYISGLCEECFDKICGE